VGSQRDELRRSVVIFVVLFSSCLAAAAPAMADDYYVQVTSQRSEGEALAAYKSLQSKFPNELRNRQPLIHRRTMVGS
jgi:hypothetical protein